MCCHVHFGVPHAAFSHVVGSDVCRLARRIGIDAMGVMHYYAMSVCGGSEWQLHEESLAGAWIIRWVTMCSRF